MIVLLNPRRNLGCIGVYTRPWAVDVSRSDLFVRVGMRTRHLNLRSAWSWTLRYALVPALVVGIVWALSVLLLSLGG